MVEPLLGPGMQDRGEADASAQAAKRDLLERLRRGREEEGVGDARNGEEERVQLGRHGEDDVEVLDGQQIALLLLDPPRFVQPLALGAMPIATGVVGDLLVAADGGLHRRAAWFTLHREAVSFKSLYVSYARLSGRYDNVVYVTDTATGHVASIPVGKEPHGVPVWPQPGRYSLGHTGNMR